MFSPQGTTVPRGMNAQWIIRFSVLAFAAGSCFAEFAVPAGGCRSCGGERAGQGSTMANPPPSALPAQLPRMELNPLQSLLACSGRGQIVRKSNAFDEEYGDSCAEQFLAAVEIAARRSTERAFHSVRIKIEEPFSRLVLRGGRKDPDDDDEDESGGYSSADEAPPTPEEEIESEGSEITGSLETSEDQEDDEVGAAKSKRPAPTKGTKGVPASKILKESKGSVKTGASPKARSAPNSEDDDESGEDSGKGSEPSEPSVSRSLGSKSEADSRDDQDSAVGSQEVEDSEEGSVGDEDDDACEGSDEEEGGSEEAAPRTPAKGSKTPAKGSSGGNPSTSKVAARPAANPTPKPAAKPTPKPAAKSPKSNPKRK